MLTPEEMDVFPLLIERLFRGLQEDIILNICRRIKASGAMTESALHQIRQLQAMGYEVDYIETRIKEVTEVSTRQLNKLYEEAIERNNAFNRNISTKLDLLPEPQSTKLLTEQLVVIRKMTEDNLYNITQSMGFREIINGQTRWLPVAEFYQNQLDKAFIQVSTGGMDYNTAIRNIVDEMVDSGLRTVEFESGRTQRIDVVARRAVLTGLNQASAVQTESAMKEFGTDLVEVSAHQGARDTGDGPENHKAWQGKVYSFSGNRTDYPSLVAVTGYGTGEGLQGWNCRHSFFAFIEDFSTRVYTDEQLKNIDSEPFKWRGKEYSAYEATQTQRKYESAIRDQKLKIVATQEAGLLENITVEKMKLTKLKNDYVEFSGVAGLKLQNERLRIPKGLRV